MEKEKGKRRERKRRKMLIINQTKFKIFNFNKMPEIHTLYNYTGDGKHTMIQSGEEFLGLYATEERAKEILLDIANAYGRGIKVYEMPEK